MSSSESADSKALPPLQRPNRPPAHLQPQRASQASSPQAPSQSPSLITAAELKKTNLYLVGMMGAGKTTIGKKLANRLGYRFLDTDALIEQSTGRTVTDLFAQEGETGFREIETQVLAQVSTHTSLVVATGGGIVTQQMNWSYLRHGVVIWLDVPVAVLASRLAGDSTRPLIQDVDLSEKLTKLLTERGDRYGQSDIRIGYEGKSVKRTCDRILIALKQNLRPDPKLAAEQMTINQSSINPVIDPVKQEKTS
ncbi:MAG: shikimate kinase [Cyanobacteria bacterium J06614_10]